MEHEDLVAEGKERWEWSNGLEHFSMEVAYITCTLTYFIVTYFIVEINNLAKLDIVKAPSGNEPSNEGSSREKYQIFWQSNHLPQISYLLFSGW